MPSNKRKGTDDNAEEKKREEEAKTEDQKKKLLKSGVVRPKAAQQISKGIFVAGGAGAVVRNPLQHAGGAGAVVRNPLAVQQRHLALQQKSGGTPTAAPTSRLGAAQLKSARASQKAASESGAAATSQPSAARLHRPKPDRSPAVSSKKTQLGAAHVKSVQKVQKETKPRTPPPEITEAVQQQAVQPQQKSAPVASTTGAQPQQQSAPAAGVLVIGTDAQMYKMLLKFGPPDATERHKVQQLLALPCRLCDPNLLLSAAEKGIETGIRELARKLRPDINASVRAVHLKRAIMQLGADFLQLDGYYCLSAVTLPFGLEEIKASSTERERHIRKEVWNHIDLRVTAMGQCLQGDVSPEATAFRALKESCGIRIAPELWDEGVQSGIRSQLGMDLTLRLNAGSGSWVVVLVLPDDAVTSTGDGLLNFESSARAVHETGLPEEMIVLAGPPVLPAFWLQVRSRITGQVFFFNMQTQEAHLVKPAGMGDF